MLHTLCKRAHWRRNLHVRTLVAVVKIRLSRPRPLTLRFLPGLTRALTKIASHWIFRPCGWPLFFPGKRKGHMDEFVHVAVNCKLNTYGHHGYKPDWLVSMRYKPLSEIAVIVRVIKLCCFSLSHDQHSFAQKLTLLACFKAYTHNLSLSTQVFAGRLANRISEYRKMSKNVDIMAILAGAPFA